MKPQTGTNIIKPAERKKSVVLKHRTLASEQEAKRIIGEAEEFAKQTTRDAETAAVNAYQEAKEKGREEALAEFESLVLAATDIRDKAFEQSEKDLVRLSVKLAEKILGRELTTKQAAIADIVNTALQHARQKESLLIRVNPADLSAAQSDIEKYKSTSQSKYIDIVADPNVGPGGCLIESEVGTVDARLETQFRVLEKALLNRTTSEGGNGAGD